MANATFYGTTGDGYLQKAYPGNQWWTARDAASADFACTGMDTPVTGNAYLLPVGWLSGHLLRSFCVFDTSSIPDDAEVTAATLQLYLDDEDTNPLGHEIVLMHSEDHPGQQVDTGDFDRTYYKGGGAPNVKVWSGQAPGTKTWTLNSTGRGWISATGSTWFCLRSEFDVSPALPGAGMFAEFYSSLKGGAYRPRLDVTYGTKPSVTTAAASGIGSSYATANATGADPGSGTFSEYGFIYNDDGSDPLDIPHADERVEASNLADGAFSASLTGLSSSKSYQYRAYVTTELATTYGATGSFSTTAAPDTLTVSTNAPTPVTATGATLKGTIVSDGGDSITEHGFIWKASSDPLQPAAGGLSNPTGADHYALLGTGSEGAFSYGVTGLSTGTAYMVRAFAQTTGGTDYGGLRVFRTGTLVEDTIYATTGGTAGRSLYKQSDLWNVVTYPDKSCSTECRDVESASSVDGQSSTVQLRCYYGYPYGYPYAQCWIRRGYIYFDTSGIPAGATILSASLSVYISNTVYHYSDTGPGWCRACGFSVWTSSYYPSLSGGEPALATGDYDKDLYAFVTGADHDWVMPGGYGTGYSECYLWSGGPHDYVSVVIPAAKIIKGGVTRFCLRRHDPDVCGGFDQNSAYCTYETAFGNHPPKLELTYILPGEGAALPSVNVGDDWKTTKTGLINVGGQWRLIEAARINVGGSWRDAI